MVRVAWSLSASPSQTSSFCSHLHHIRSNVTLLDRSLALLLMGHGSPGKRAPAKLSLARRWKGVSSMPPIAVHMTEKVQSGKYKHTTSADKHTLAWSLQENLCYPLHLMTMSFSQECSDQAYRWPPLPSGGCATYMALKNQVMVNSYGSGWAFSNTTVTYFQVLRGARPTSWEVCRVQLPHWCGHNSISIWDPIKTMARWDSMAYQQYAQFPQEAACSSGTYILLNDTPNPKWGFAFKCCNVSYMIQGLIQGLYVFLFVFRI